MTETNYGVCCTLLNHMKLQ